MPEKQTRKSKNDSAPLLHQSSHSTKSGSITANSRRRKSKLTSGGRWDWSYETDNPRFSRLSNDDQTFGIKFSVLRRSRFFLGRKKDLVLSVSVAERTLRVSSAKKSICLPTASVSRLTPQGDKQLEIRAAAPPGNTGGGFFSSRKLKSWIRVVEFDSVGDRNEFLNLVRGLNAVGGMVSSMYWRVENGLTPEKLVKCLLAVENEPGYEPPTPKNPLDETEFFRWFLLVSHDRDPNVLLKKLEEKLTDNEMESVVKGPTPPPPSTDTRSMAGSLSKRGPLYCSPKFAPTETVIIVEDTVTFVARLDSKEVRHIVGELVLTNLRLYFSVYESELTKRPSMTALTGVHGLAKYIGELEAGRAEHAASENGSERSETEKFISSSACRGISEQDGLFVRDTRASLDSLRFGRRPDTVFVTLNVFLSSLSKVECKHSNLVVETTLGRQCVFQFDRGDSYVATFVERVSEARKSAFFMGLVADAVSFETPAIYDAKQEFARQASASSVGTIIRNRFASFENSGYDLCSTYPSQFVVPHDFARNPSKMDAVARFRSRARVPAVTWAHGRFDVVLSRSSQPLTGIKQAKCIEDEELLSQMGGGRRMFIVDARGPAAVAGNQLARGKGTEVASRYPDVTFLYMGIGNIHTMRSSQEKLALACSPGSFDSDRFLQRVEESKWLMHVRIVLDAATRCAELLDLEQASVLVHCSDGWDRTAQLVSLAQLILDPFYRTIQGLAVLIEKDWVAFGFRFKDRCSGSDEDEKSPIWIQFLDCLFQYRRQFPNHFEYQENLLCVLADAPYSGRYATFGFNTEGDRAEACRRNKSRAWEFWTEVLSRHEFINASFEPFEGPLWPNTSSKRLVLWEALHLRCDASTPLPNNL